VADGRLENLKASVLQDLRAISPADQAVFIADLRCWLSDQEAVLWPDVKDLE